MEKEITQEQMISEISSMPINKGGIPKYLMEDTYLPYIDLLTSHLKTIGIRIAYIKEVL